MLAQPANLTIWARCGSALLCLLVAGSVSVRIYTYWRLSEGNATVAWEASGASVDLGDGVLLPRSAAQHRTLQHDSCPTPVSVDFVTAGPYGPDPSLVGAPQPNDHVVYVYRGWNLGSRAASVSLNAIHFARRAYARLAMQKNPAADDWAVKLIVPAGCDASPENLMSVLRSALQPEPSSVPSAAPHP